MSQESVPTLRRSHSTSNPSAGDPYDQAEQGLRSSLAEPPSARPPLEPRQTHSTGHSRRSSERTLVDEHFETDVYDIAEKPLPRQEPPSQSPARLRSWGGRLYRLFFTRRKPPESQLQRSNGFQSGYDQFYYEDYRNYPDGWPRVAAFMESSDSFSIFRKFGHCHTRLLISHMSNITDLETELHEIDKRDELGGKDTEWRLKNRYHEEGMDTTKRNLETRLEKEIIAYGTTLYSSYRKDSYSANMFPDTLLLKFGALKSLSHTPARDHDSVFKWLWANKPLDEHEFDWIFRPEDFISLVPPRRNRFESFILRHLDASPNSCFKKIFQPSSFPNPSSLTHIQNQISLYSTHRISTIARLIVVFCAVLILFIPVILFLLTSMSRACMVVVVLGFMGIFSVGLGLLTDAGDKEIFVGTATYCAVLVTFLGNLQRSVDAGR